MASSSSSKPPYFCAPDPKKTPREYDRHVFDNKEAERSHHFSFKYLTPNYEVPEATLFNKQFTKSERDALSARLREEAKKYGTGIIPHDVLMQCVHKFVKDTFGMTLNMQQWKLQSK